MRVENVHAILYVSFQQRVASCSDLSEEVFHVGNGVEYGAEWSKNANLRDRVSYTRANLTDREQIVSH